VDLHHSRVAVDRDPLAVAQAACGVAERDHGGMPYSRATSEACATTLPPSVTTPAARPNSGALG
jgi:hypothetical protein